MLLNDLVPVAEDRVKVPVIDELPVTLISVAPTVRVPAVIVKLPASVTAEEVVHPPLLPFKVK